MYSRTVSQCMQGFLKGFQNLSTVLLHECRSASSQVHCVVLSNIDTPPSAKSATQQHRQVTWCQRRLLHFSAATFAAKAKNSRKKVVIYFCVLFFSDTGQLSKFMRSSLFFIIINFFFYFFFFGGGGGGLGGLLVYLAEFVC